MAREIRRVPPGWEHPRNENGHYRALLDGLEFESRCVEWDRDAAAFAAGEYGDTPSMRDAARKALAKGETWAGWAGARPDPICYTALRDPAACTAYQVYEDTSEGTPVSPVFETIDAMREWFEAGPMIGFANRSPLGVGDMEIMLQGGGAGYGIFYLPAVREARP